MKHVLAEPTSTSAGSRSGATGKLAEISDFRANDKLTATIVTTKPPRVMTEREVNATLAKSGGVVLPARPRPLRAPAPSTPRHSAVSVPVRGDLGRCAEEAAQDRQPSAACWADGRDFSSRGIGHHRRPAPRDALAVSLMAGPRVIDGARPARCSTEARVFEFLPPIPRSMK